MKILTKLSWGFIIVIFLIAIAGYFALSTGQRKLREATGNEYATFSAEILDKIDRHINDRIEIFHEYSNNFRLRKHLVELNLESMKLDDIQHYIKKQDHLPSLGAIAICGKIQAECLIRRLFFLAPLNEIKA